MSRVIDALLLIAGGMALLLSFSDCVSLLQAMSKGLPAHKHSFILVIDVLVLVLISILARVREERL
jgi:hypothetical protein